MTMLRLFLSVLPLILVSLSGASNAGAQVTAEADAEATGLQRTCSRSGPDVDVKDQVHLALWSGDTLLLLLGGNTQQAIDELGGDLANQVIILDSVFRQNPCKASPEALSKIETTLRVIAAINDKHPIPAIQGNKQALEALQRAISDDPDNYRHQLERSRNWDHGIR